MEPISVDDMGVRVILAARPKKKNNPAPLEAYRAGSAKGKPSEAANKLHDF